LVMMNMLTNEYTHKCANGVVKFPCLDKAGEAGAP
jgi:hypothetical protein